MPVNKYNFLTEKIYSAAVLSCSVKRKLGL